MALDIGIDSYVSLAEAEEYIAGMYMSNSTQLSEWSGLSDGDKEIALKNAATAIDNVRYMGFKKDSSQRLSFPRCYKSQSHIDECIMNKVCYDEACYCEECVTDFVKHAQIEEALELACPAEDTKDFDALNGAVSSYSVSSLSETFKSSCELGALQSELRSKIAQRLLKKYTGGGYSVN